MTARAVGAHEMIVHLPDGYDHEVGERGRNLSAGQRQLIALARAELADPDILLLDEATAALDLASEAAMTATDGSFRPGRTTIVVAHRLTTAARADRIIVMDHGRISRSVPMTSCWKRAASTRTSGPPSWATRSTPRKSARVIARTRDHWVAYCQPRPAGWYP